MNIKLRTLGNDAPTKIEMCTLRPKNRRIDKRWTYIMLSCSYSYSIDLIVFEEHTFSQFLYCHNLKTSKATSISKIPTFTLRSCPSDQHSFK